MKIGVAGLGYVGLSNAVLLSQKNEVYAFDINQNIVEMLQNKISHIKDAEIEDFLAHKELNLHPTNDTAVAYKDAEYVVVATPTNYDPDKNYFDTSSVEKAIDAILEVNKDVTIIIKSTIPVGYTLELRKKYNYENIIFSPEFLREGRA